MLGVAGQVVNEVRADMVAQEKGEVALRKRLLRLEPMAAYVLLLVGLVRRLGTWSWKSKESGGCRLGSQGKRAKSPCGAASRNFRFPDIVYVIKTYRVINDLYIRAL